MFLGTSGQLCEKFGRANGPPGLVLSVSLAVDGVQGERQGAQNRVLESHQPSIDGAEAICCEGVAKALKRWTILDDGLGR